MAFKDKVAGFSWGFLFLVTLLQLTTSGELPFITAVSFTVCLVFTFQVYLKEISHKRVRDFLSGLNTVLLVVVMNLFCMAVTLVLTAEGYLIIKLTAGESADKIIAGSTSSIFGLYMFSAFISGLDYLFEKYKDFLEQEKELEILKRKSLEMEINLLRSQLSPHFTFNILNNLQILIRRDKDEALHLLSRYSKILRYYVYESQKKLIPLDQEIAFLKEYFDLEISRHVSELKISCVWNIPENDLRIVPFVLSTFVENAFKHVLPNQANEYFIRQSCFLNEQGDLVFEITNTFDEGVIATTPKGVGLKHVEERLKLAYSDQYQLILTEKKELFSARLELKTVELR
jgi:two-component system LytT family sensor kinase